MKATERLLKEVRALLPKEGEETARLVTAVAGLLGSVAYADREYRGEEREHIREELSRVHGVGRDGADAVCNVLERELKTLCMEGDQIWTRVLRDLVDRETRVEVLDVLVDLASADGVISLAEVNVLRRITAALGLDQNDYDTSQARHRQKLSVLSPHSK